MFSSSSPAKPFFLHTVRMPRTKAAARLNEHYKAFLEQHQQPPRIIFASLEVIVSYRDLPLNVIPSEDKSEFRGVPLRYSTAPDVLTVYSLEC